MANDKYYMLRERSGVVKELGFDFAPVSYALYKFDKDPVRVFPEENSCDHLDCTPEDFGKSIADFLRSKHEGIDPDAASEMLEAVHIPVKVPYLHINSNLIRKLDRLSPNEYFNVMSSVSDSLIE